MNVCIFVNDEQNFPKEKMLKICIWSAMSLYFEEGSKPFGNNFDSPILLKLRYIDFYV